MWRTKGETCARIRNMGGERASTGRQRLSGKICGICRRHLPPPHTPGEKRCDKCSRHRVYMSFMLRETWFCQFLEEDLRTPLPRKVELRDAQQICEMAERGGCDLNLEARQAFDHAIEIGRGGVWLELTGEQYEKLKQSNRGPR
jgi:hypothetical protein